MKKLAFSMENEEFPYVMCKQTLREIGFSLGGGWDYRQGLFDCALDAQQTLFLRLPFDVSVGKLDETDEAQGTMIRWRTPFVLRHLYETGTDDTSAVRVLGGLFDQFQKPRDADAPLTEENVELAQRLLTKVEQQLAKLSETFKAT